MPADTADDAPTPARQDDGCVLDHCSTRALGDEHYKPVDKLAARRELSAHLGLDARTLAVVSSDGSDC